MTIREIEMSDFRYQGQKIPEHMIGGLARYIEDHIPPGDFLREMLSNNLHEALGRADDKNMWMLPVYSAYLYNHVPSRCFGSKEKYEKWLSTGD